MNDILYNTDIDYKVVGNEIYLFKKVAQDKNTLELKGKVVDEQGEPLIGVSVTSLQNNSGTITDIDGNYSLKVYKGENLLYAFIGLKPQVRTVLSSTLNVKLLSNTEELGEIVVTGYSTQSRKQMTTAVAKLDTKVLESASRSNPATALQGTIAGLKVVQTTGQPGSTPSIQLRGGTGFDGSGTPLILIDGVPGSFYALNSDDIQSIEVLKDAASTAIYGARAANGVVIVTTKKGKKGSSHITFRSKYTLNQPKKDKMQYLGAADYVKFNRMAVRNTRMVRGDSNFGAFLDGQNSAATGNNTTNSIYTTMFLDENNKYLLDREGWMKMKDPLSDKDLIFMENKFNNLFYQPSSIQDYSLSFDGGNDKSTYYLGLGYMNDKGLVVGSGFKRFSGTVNASYNITDDFKVSSNIIYAQSSQDLPFDSIYNLFQRTAGLAPTSRIYNNNPDGSLSDEYQPGTYLGFGNPLYYKDKFPKSNLEQRLTASIQADYSFLKNFKLTLRGSHFTVNNSKEAFEKAYLSSGNLNTSRKASASYARTIRNQFTGLLNYNTRINKHNISALLGTEYFHEYYYSMNGATRNSPTDLIYTMNVGSEADGKPSSYRTQYAISSVFGQFNYDFDYKYLLGITFRYDGTSRLANDKYGFFPGISFGWNAHNEDFFKNSKISNIISKLKPRISYGINGNIDNLSNFGVFGTYGLSGTYNGLKGYVNNALPNLGLRWERSTTFNMGLDLGLFRNRVNIVADYFVRDVVDKLSDLTLPLWTGFSSIKTNNGILQNRGLELELNANVIKRKDFNWNIGSTFYLVRNYAKKLPANGVEKNRQGGTEIYDPATGKTKYVGGLQEGERVGNDLIVAYEFDGVYHTEEEIAKDAARKVEFALKKNTRFLGDSKWKDQNGDNIIDYRDRIVIGRTTPSFIGGITTNLTYKNFDLFIKGDYAVGHYILNGRRIKGVAQTQGNQNGPVEIRDSWTSENPNSNVPRFDLVDPQHNHLAGGSDQGDIHNSSSRYIERGDYFALREITLGYSFNGNKLHNIFQNARLYFSIVNIAYFSAYSGVLPEQGGTDTGRYPLPRSFTMGLNITF